MITKGDINIVNTLFQKKGIGVRIILESRASGDIYYIRICDISKVCENMLEKLHVFVKETQPYGTDITTESTKQNIILHTKDIVAIREWLYANYNFAIPSIGEAYTPTCNRDILIQKYWINHDLDWLLTQARFIVKCSSTTLLTRYTPEEEYKGDISEVVFELPCMLHHFSPEIREATSKLVTTASAKGFVHKMYDDFLYRDIIHFIPNEGAKRQYNLLQLIWRNYGNITFTIVK